MTMAGIEVAAVRAAISTTLNVVVNKLAPPVIEWYNSVDGVAEDLLELLDLVKEIKRWLDTSGYEAMVSDTSFNWLKRLKEVAYDVDDIVDEFQLKAEKHCSASSVGIMSEYIMKPKSFIFRCKVASKIKKIKRRFAAVVKQRTDFTAVANSISVDPPVRPRNMRTGEISSWPDIDVTSVVGRVEDKKQIISKLEENDVQQKIKIISILGLGGSGKTTLVKLVFNDDKIKKHFKVTLWVHVSQEFDVDKLVKKMFEAFADNNPGQHGVPYMKKTISDKLIGKRFLLVLDDVWIESQFHWEKISEFLINTGAPGSRILLTTRSSKVAETVGSTDPFKLPLLSEASSWQLFMESYGMSANNLASEFLKAGKEIVGKCGGVPLAIKVLAGVLRGKEHIDQWKAMRDSNLLYVEGEEHRVAACLMLSYFHLPSYLKQCFTICSLFPKGHRIDKDQLIDLWIAHDMITVEDGVDCLDYVGHKCFNSLVQMSFLQDVEEEDRRVRCKMHDLVHDLARSILGDEVSSVVPMEATKSTKRYRYLSLINQTTIILPKNMFEKARAVYAAACGNPIFGKDLKNARHLRSIMVEDIPVVSVPTTILQIKNLRYISISKVWILRALPEAISDAWSLQALHVTDCRNFVELPGTIGKLQKLRTLNLSGCKSLKRLPNSIGDCQMISSIDLYHCKKLTVLPNSIGKLQKLKTLKLSLCEELKCLPESFGDCQMISSIDLCNCWELKALPNSICRNEKLRVLRLGNTQIESLPSSFTMLRDLECLDLNKCRELVELPEGIGHLEKLQVLNLKDCEKLRGMPVGIGKLSGLQKLGLFVVGEGKKFAKISELAHIGRNSEDLIIRGIAHVMEPDDAHKTCLKHKTNLKRLNLEWKRYHVGEVNSELEQDVLDGLELPPGIKELKIRGYSGTQYARWMQNEVGGGVQGLAYFQLLRVMNLCNFSNLKHLHGLVELPSLEELVLRAMPSLESISGGPFPALVKLVLYKLPSLGELWIVTERTISNGEEGGSCSNCTPYLGQVQVGNCITYLDITDCPKLKFKPYLPLSLQHWKLSGSSEQLLQSPDLREGCTSSSSFSHLMRLRLLRMTGLGYGLESWQILSFYNTERLQGLASLTSLRSLDVSLSTICELPECLGELRSLQKLTIQSCHSLRSLPQSMGHLTSLQVLSVDWCHALQHLPECLGELCSLRTLYVGGLRNINSFPQSLRYLTSLRDLRIGGCDALHELPECLGELRSLCKLYIIGLRRLTCFPKSLCRLTSLELLRITDCPGLTSLPQGMKSFSSLEKLSIFSCPGIKTLPEGIKGLTSLKELWIQGCPDLAVRCEREKGEDWHLISHIPVCLGILTASLDLGHPC